jgi:hypothetical protein
MSQYNAYGELYDERPELVIHDRFRHSGTVREIIKIAQENNYKISFSPGPFRNDMIIKQDGDKTEKPESYNISSGLRYFRRLSQ